MEEIDLKQLFLIVWNKKIHIIIIMILFFSAGLVYSFNFVEPKYKSYTTLILAKVNYTAEGNSTESDQITQTDITLNSKLISTYSELIKSSTLLQTVKDNLNLDIDETDLKKSITVNTISDTELIEISVVNDNPKQAAIIANEIAKEFAIQVEKIYKINNIYIIDQAKVDTNPCNINHLKDVTIFTIIGLAVSIVYVALCTALDTTVKSTEDLENGLGVYPLVSIPFIKDNVKNNFKAKELITYNEVKSVVSEIFRTLRTNVQFMNTKGKKTILLTSCFPGEGKSYVSANLAVTFAQAGKKVILVDADMRRGRQGKIFNVDSRCGLSNYLSNLDENGMEIANDISKYIKETDVTNLNIISAGNVPPNPSELLTSDRIESLLNELNKVYDIIIVDGAPILPVTDSLILSRLIGATILVTSYKKTKKDDLAKVIKSIENVGGRVIGAVLNKVPNQVVGYENTYYYYGDNDMKKKKIIVNNKKIENKFLDGVKRIVNKFKTRNRRLKSNNNEIIEKQHHSHEVVKEEKIETDIKKEKEKNNTNTVQSINEIQNLEQEEKKMKEELERITSLKNKLLEENKKEESEQTAPVISKEELSEMISEEFLMENLYPKTKNNKNM